MQKKKWVKPKAIVINKLSLDESVLANCKVLNSSIEFHKGDCTGCKLSGSGNSCSLIEALNEKKYLE
jgi:hypothetical protein